MFCLLHCVAKTIVIFKMDSLLFKANPRSKAQTGSYYLSSESHKLSYYFTHEFSSTPQCSNGSSRQNSSQPLCSKHQGLTSLSITFPVLCPVTFCSSAKLYTSLCLPGSHLAHPEASVSLHPRWHPPRLQKAQLQLCSIWYLTELSTNPCDFY